ncbi:hypothetical protein GCM10010289_71950 [Streptomyces violascens]|nr:hypothetical protein GCM10010289_71950 [Streptomyces violascens]
MLLPVIGDRLRALRQSATAGERVALVAVEAAADPRPLRSSEPAFGHLSGIKALPSYRAGSAD